MRPNCECCDVDIHPEDTRVFICSFECTWCAECVATFAGRRCPNCGGTLTPRPTRSAAARATSPVSTVRVHNPDCLGAR
ncbi:MAG: DUF1272 domain-containing protein [Mycetocola sp.]